MKEYYYIAAGYYWRIINTIIKLDIVINNRNCAS